MNVFLSCTKEKENKKCKACEMYMPSSLFSKSYKYAKSLNPDHIYILSAKHHLLNLDDMIDPYNQTLNDATEDECREWAEECIKQMKDNNINFNAKTYFLAGESYIKYLREHFPNREEVFDGKGIGEIMHWLDKENGELEESLYDYLNIYSVNEDVNKYIL